MSTNRTDKELAFLYDLYVAPDWGERFAELFDEHVVLPKAGRALYVAAGTGGHALAVVERAGGDVSLMCVDESEERLELAREKAKILKSGAQVEFRLGQPDGLGFEDEQFELVMGDASLVVSERLPEMLSEMVRVAVPGATIALNLTTASSFGEFFSIYWEALGNVGLGEHGSTVEALINELHTVSDVEAMAAREALDDVQSWTRIEEFNFPSGEEFISAPLIRDFLLGGWLDALPDDEARGRVVEEVARIIDEERQGGDFALSIKATLVVGRKAD
ncbi:MAG TPA: class I SAM-dependent methyltransferase [Pyrinomonadaceae bacterium]|jgi:ubiquinone/menaquinone biosynthesis C-methylase UbiE